MFLCLNVLLSFSIFPCRRSAVPRGSISSTFGHHGQALTGGDTSLPWNPARPMSDILDPGVYAILAGIAITPIGCRLALPLVVAGIRPLVWPK